MHMRMVAIVGLAAAGCGGSSISADKGCTDEVNARCALYMSCSNGTLLTTRYGDLATCQAREKAACLNRLLVMGTTATPAFEEACAAALPAESCVEFLDDQPAVACIAPLGAQTDGAVCVVNAQCASGYCNLGTHTVCGTCGAPANAGDSCAAATCARGLICFGATPICVAPGAMSAACDAKDPCQADLVCVGASAKMMKMGTCQTAVAVAGMPCDPLSQTSPACARGRGLTCDPTSKTCVAINYAAAGAACGVVNGLFIGCGAGGGCYPIGGMSQTCAASAADGAACDTVAGPGCLAPAKCVTTGSATAGTCQLPPCSLQIAIIRWSTRRSARTSW